MRISRDRKRRAQSGLAILIATAAGMNVAGCMEEAAGWAYCLVILPENQTTETVRISYTIGPENASITPNNTQTETYRLQAQGSPGGVIGLHGSNEKKQRIDVKHESGSVTSRLLVAESIPTQIVVLEYHSEVIVIKIQDARDEGWKRNPCNYHSELE